MSGSNIGMENKRPLEVGAKTTDCGYRGVLPYRFIAASLLLAFIAISLCIAMDGESIDADPPSSGDCGGGLEWKYEDYKLKITKSDSSGFTGIMDDYKEDNPSPWNAYADDITMVEITGYTVRIGDYAFYKLTDLTTLKVTDNTTPPDLEQIGDHAFDECKKLDTIKFGDTVKNIGDFSKLTSIGDYAFNKCKFTGNLTIPNNVETIGDYAFNGCFTQEEPTDWKLTLLSNNLTTIGNYAFNGCKFTGNLTIPDSVTSIGNYAFNKCKFTGALIIPDKVTSIGSHAFNECGFNESLTLGSSITRIGGYSFCGCEFIGSLTISK